MPRRILLVDDDEMVLMALNELLKPEGYDVHSVAGGAEALEKLARNRYDLLILDVIMPGMDGFELCRRTREREKCREDDRAEGLEAGGNLFLSKPISPDRLLEIISETLG